MQSPFKTWCYNCNAYRNADVKFRWAPNKKKGRGSAKSQPLAIEYLATCPCCHDKMVPDKKLRQVIALSVHVLEVEMEKAKKQLASS